MNGPSYADQLIIALQYIKSKSKKGKKPRVAYMAFDIEAGRAPVPAFLEKAKMLGIDIVAKEFAAITSKDVTSQLLRIRAANPDWLIIHGATRMPLLAAKTARRLKIKAPIIMTVWSTGESMVKQLGKFGEGILAVTPFAFWHENVPGMNELKDYTRKHHPKVKLRNVFFIRNWIMAKIIAEAVKKAILANDLSRDGIRNALEGLSGFSTGGMTGPINFKNHKFDYARIVKANPKGGIWEPHSDWIKVSE